MRNKGDRSVLTKGGDKYYINDIDWDKILRTVQVRKLPNNINAYSIESIGPHEIVVDE